MHNCSLTCVTSCDTLLEDLSYMGNICARFDIFRSVVETAREVLSRNGLSPKKEPIDLFLHFFRPVVQTDWKTDWVTPLQAYLNPRSVHLLDEQFANEPAPNLRRTTNFDMYVFASKHELSVLASFDKDAALREYSKLVAQLENEHFIQKARPDVVEKTRQRVKELERACNVTS